jgi:hypothetical protein
MHLWGDRRAPKRPIDPLGAYAPLRIPPAHREQVPLSAGPQQSLQVPQAPGAMLNTSSIGCARAGCPAPTVGQPPPCAVEDPPRRLIHRPSHSAAVIGLAPHAPAPTPERMGGTAASEWMGVADSLSEWIGDAAASNLYAPSSIPVASAPISEWMGDAAASNLNAPSSMLVASAPTSEWTGGAAASDRYAASSILAASAPTSEWMGGATTLSECMAGAGAFKPHARASLPVASRGGGGASAYGPPAPSAHLASSAGCAAFAEAAARMAKRAARRRCLFPEFPS